MYGLCEKILITVPDIFFYINNHDLKKRHLVGYIDFVIVQ
jgi:hypothetical protein